MALHTLSALASEPFCYVTTVGRRTGTDHTIEIWFVIDGDSLYLISGGRDRSDWVRNLQADPGARVRVGNRELRTQARAPITEPVERDRAVALLHAKYRAQVSGTLEGWKRDAFIVALDLDGSTP